MVGRCFSADHGAHSSARSMGTCMALGQAAGTTAALAARTNQPAGSVEPHRVRDRLAADGAIVEPAAIVTYREPEVAR
jgi:hypothetical protein